MALKKQTLVNGKIADYWVAETSMDIVAKVTKIEVKLFESETTRNAGAQPIGYRVVPDAQGIWLTGEQVYTHIKAEDEFFADAEDV